MVPHRLVGKFPIQLCDTKRSRHHWLNYRCFERFTSSQLDGSACSLKFYLNPELRDCFIWQLCCPESTTTLQTDQVGQVLKIPQTVKGVQAEVDFVQNWRVDYEWDFGSHDELAESHLSRILHCSLDCLHLLCHWNERDWEWKWLVDQHFRFVRAYNRSKVHCLALLGICHHDYCRLWRFVSNHREWDVLCNVEYACSLWCVRLRRWFNRDDCKKAKHYWVWI